MNSLYIIAHIVGINSQIKESFINNLYVATDGDVAIIDLDKINKKIKNNKDFQKVLVKQNQNEIASLWKKKFNNLMKKKLKKVTKHNVIFVGSTCFQRYAKTFIEIPTGLKLIFKENEKKYLKELITHYLDKYREHIVNGTFPLKYLDPVYLLDEKHKMEEIHQTKGYMIRPEQAIQKLILLHMKRFSNIPSLTKVKKLYYSSMEEFDDLINYGQEPISAYTHDWLAVLSSIPNVNKKIEKGFDVVGKKLYPFIRELKPKAFEDLQSSTFLYHVDKTVFKAQEGERGFKFLAYEPVKILKRVRVANIHKKLLQKNIKFIKYKKQS
jgi:hypothetical protein